ncbi:hypothetical protein EDD21DRAFT_392411 [Dissophora ornata]|nr:hypothetical protein BGZ58_000935 [Dissophora ornata]KAI8594973.1 hypothetical protein EDD21DRAFT_392411 [Dissophora ornata]
MDPMSQRALLGRILSLETALSKCKIELMNEVRYSQFGTKPYRPNQDTVENLEIWLTSTSYIDYYRNIARRLEGLRELYRSERLTSLGYGSQGGGGVSEVFVPSSVSPGDYSRSDDSSESTDSDYHDGSETSDSSKGSGSLGNHPIGQFPGKSLRRTSCMFPATTSLVMQRAHPLREFNLVDTGSSRSQSPVPSPSQLSLPSERNSLQG